MIAGPTTSLFSSGNLIIGVSGKTMNIPPLSSASIASSRASPTSSTVNTRKRFDNFSRDFFSVSFTPFESLNNWVSANHGHSEYAFILSSSHGLGSEHSE